LFLSFLSENGKMEILQQREGRKGGQKRGREFVFGAADLLFVPRAQA
jgi:hypothetical protein